MTSALRRASVGVLLLLTSLVEAGEPKTIPLFNGKNLDGWYVFTTETGKENPGLFTVVDGMLKVAGGVEGKAYLGGLITKEPYENYKLVFEYRWGGPTYGKRAQAARDSGVLVHCIGPDGPGPWPTSVECQIIEGGTGDVILIPGKDDQGKPVTHSATFPGRKFEGQYYYKPGGPQVTVSSGRINWYGRDPAWKDVLGFRGKEDVESPGREWTHVECICDDGSMTNIVNGKTVVALTGLPHHKGRILLQTEGAEIWFRKVELTPLR